MKTRDLLAVAAAAALSWGCAPAASYAPSQPAVVFPTRTELAKIRAAPAAPEAFGGGDVAVDSWSFDSLPAGDGAAYDDASPWGDLARELVKAHAATTTLSEPLRCAAREIGRFQMQHGGLPTESLRRFMAARCGSSAVGASPVVWQGAVAASVGADALVAKNRAAIAKLFDEKLSAGHHLVGLAASRSESHAAIVVVVANDEARLEATSRSVDARRRVTLRGAARAELTEIGALINRGDAGTARCEPDPLVEPPRFAVTCELAEGDRFAWVDVYGRTRGHMLMREIAGTLVYEGDGRDVAYASKHAGPPAPVTAPKELARAIVDGVNRVRRQAKLEPLAIAAKQSEEDERLVGTLLNASYGVGDEDAADKAALGLLAGWEVGGVIRTGSFFVGAVSPTRDATAWVDYALERPLARVVLLDPAARRIAVGPAVPAGTEALGAVVTTYALFESDDHTRDEARFVERLAAARTARGLPAPVRVRGFDTIARETDLVLREGKVPMAALDDMMRAVVARTGSSVRGYVLETSDLEATEIPRQLLGAGPLRAVVAVTHHRVAGAAWGQYVVFVIVLAPTTATDA
jgi:hypothetical protein